MDQEIKITIDELIKYKTESEKLRLIEKLIFESTRLSYVSTELTVDKDENLMTYLKVVENEKYNNRVKELQKEQEAKNNG